MSTSTDLESWTPSRPGSPQRPLRVAIVGSGPTGFYAAGQLLGAGELIVRVDMFERLTTPWGLVRAGVAPDHPNIKAVTRVYEKIARLPGFAFYGNVEVGDKQGDRGAQVTPAELSAHYDAVVYAVGSATDRRLGIPGEDLLGSHAATEFVAWYNGHPDYCERHFDLSVKRAIVIGNGNVALDVARMLALTSEELARTDIADHALEALARSSIEEIVLLGRRGPAQAAYTNPELRELGDLTAADVIVDPGEVELDAHTRSFLESGSADVTTRRNVEIVTDYAQRAPTGKPKRVVLRFLTSPIAVVGADRVEGVQIVRNELVADRYGQMAAQPTDRVELLEAGLVLRSIGYCGTPLPGVPFNERTGTISNDRGHVIDPHSRQAVPGLYAAGWIKRGPSGVIGTNKKCAQETIALLLEDLDAGRLPAPTGDPDALLQGLRHSGTCIVEYPGWDAIDAHERNLGEPQGRPRVKLVRQEELLDVATSAMTADV